jgi:hypothetical protein
MIERKTGIWWAGDGVSLGLEGDFRDLQGLARLVWHGAEGKGGGRGNRYQNKAII